MSSRPNTKEDQAQELRNLLEEVGQNGESNETSFEKSDEIEIDVLNLPPRKEVHTESKGFKFKISKPFMRLALTVIFVLLCLGFALYIWQDELVSLLQKL